jgi:hypothetical protein
MPQRHGFSAETKGSQGPIQHCSLKMGPSGRNPLAYRSALMKPYELAALTFVLQPSHIEVFNIAGLQASP